MSYLLSRWHLTLHNHGAFSLSPQKGLVMDFCAGELHQRLCLMAELTQG